MVKMTSDIFLSGVACTPGLTASQMVQSSSENDTMPKPRFGAHEY
ncbi:NTP-binding protein [Salmonella enterica]|nr:NTP-binding protein [Salmonella enterica]